LIKKIRQFFLNGFVLKVFFDNFEYIIKLKLTVNKKQVMKKTRFRCKLFKTKSLQFDLVFKSKYFFSCGIGRRKIVFA